MVKISWYLIDRFLSYGMSNVSLTGNHQCLGESRKKKGSEAQTLAIGVRLDPDFIISRPLLNASIEQTIIFKLSKFSSLSHI